MNDQLTYGWDQVTGTALAVLALPFLMFLLLIFFGRIISHYRGIAATTVMLVVFCMSISIFFKTWGGAAHHTSWDWFDLGNGHRFGFGFYVDNITSLLLLIVSMVSFLVHLFSIEYLRGDRNFEKYFAYLGLFTFSMIGIILSDNLLSIFVFWEMVGVSSYLLIGFYFKKDSAVYANKKAFIVNRIGDAGFLLGILVFYKQFETLDLISIKQAMMNMDCTVDQFGKDNIWLTIGGLGLFCGAIGKSAQFPLQVWLPNAMEGPTPVSALIHAATMVAAGVYLVARVFVFLPVDVLNIIATIGTITAFMGAFAAMAQNDIKRVLAFSTISQLGYMVMGMGVGAYDASLFHLMTHAFFKAGLFLCAGAVIHSMHDLEIKLHKEGKDVHFDPQDMRVMGGLRKSMPVTFACFVVCALALAGLPLFSGFLSKDAILASAIGWAQTSGGGIYYVVPVIGFLSALMTAYYMGRQLILVFFGNFRLEAKLGLKKLKMQVIETPWLMRVPIIVLATMSLGFAFSLNPIDATDGWFYKNITTPTSLSPDNYLYVSGQKVLAETQSILVDSAHHAHGFAALISIGLAVLGLGAALIFYAPIGLKTIQEKRAKAFGPSSWVNKLSMNNWYLDEIYDKIIVLPTVVKSKASYWFDQKVVDGAVNLAGRKHVVVAAIISWNDKYVVDGIVNLFARVAKMLGGTLRGLQNGKIQDYLIWTVMGLLIIMIWFISSL